MKRIKFGLLSLAVITLLFTACKKDDIDNNVDPVPESESFQDLVVPTGFDWSAIERGNLKVTIQYNGEISELFDATPIDLLDEEKNLIDRLTIFNGEAEFYYRVPSGTEKMILFLQAADQFMDVTTEESAVAFNANVQPLKNSYVDTDKDGIADRFDEFPNDADRAYSIGGSKYQSGNMSFKDDPEPGTPDYFSPNGNKYYYHIFEDLWPNVGDYDFNDMVLKSELGWDRHGDNSLKHIYIKTTVQAVGAGIHNGLGMELFKESGDELTYMADEVTWFGDVSDDPDVRNGVILFDDVRTWQNPTYNNTSNPASDAEPQSIEFQAYLPTGMMTYFELMPYLFRTSNPGQQVRHFGLPPTASADMSMFGTYDDDSPTTGWSWDVGSTFDYPLTGSNAYYRTSMDHPWGIEFIDNDFKVAKERTDIMVAYPHFQDWAESGGQNNSHWYNHPDNDEVYVPTY